ncbi:MAG TPA: MarR family transcriptional regulator [Mycobacteriales bacterium]|nr:MarR family transcriptional regulator [Mycobacteriales bacterium]
MTDFVPARAVGTELRTLFEQMDSDVGTALSELGLTGYRGRFSPYVRVLAEGPASVRQLAAATGVTHSAASQSVAAMVRTGWAAQRVGADARERIVALTDRARQALPAIRAEWEVTAAALAGLDAELPYPLSTFVTDLRAALERRPFRDRMAAAARDPGASADVAAHREVLGADVAAHREVLAADVAAHREVLGGA